MTRYSCLSCGENYPVSGLPHKCKCGGLFSMQDLSYMPERYANTSSFGMWRYMDAFGLEAQALPFWLGEGQTALVPVEIGTKTFYFKCEHLNPSGSFKDRQSAVLMSLLRARNIDEVLEDSSGNAGASLAQYAAAAKVKSRIFIPSSSSGPKRQQIKYSGANVVLVDGPRANASIAVLDKYKESGIPYASHAWLPFGLAAYATIAFEIVETLGRMPGLVFAPIGHGSLFLGLLRGFEAIEARTGQKRPGMIGVQADNCAPVYRAWYGLPAVPVNPTIAEGAAVREPVRGLEIRKCLNPQKDKLIAVKEDAIARSHKVLAAHGLYIEPTAAMVWAASEVLMKDEKKDAEDWVFILSGNGLKSIDED